MEGGLLAIPVAQNGEKTSTAGAVPQSTSHIPNTTAAVHVTCRRQSLTAGARPSSSREGLKLMHLRKLGLEALNMGLIRTYSVGTPRCHVGCWLASHASRRRLIWSARLIVIRIRLPVRGTWVRLRLTPPPPTLHCRHIGLSADCRARRLFRG